MLLTPQLHAIQVDYFNVRAKLSRPSICSDRKTSVFESHAGYVDRPAVLCATRSMPSCCPAQATRHQIVHYMPAHMRQC